MAAADSKEVAIDLSPFFRLFKDGSIDRFRPSEFHPPSDDPDAAVRSKDVVVHPQTGVAVRIFVPRHHSPPQKLPLVAYIHGGAFCVGSAFSLVFHRYVTNLVEKANVIAVSIDYRLAPENPLPNAYDDSWTAFKWIAAHAGSKGPEPWLNEYADFGRVFIGGDSAGANIANDVAVRAGVEKLEGVNILGLFLVHPFFGGKEEDKLYKLLCPWSSARDDDPRLNPAVDPRIGQMPARRVMFIVAEKDFLRERGRACYEGLKKSEWKGEADIMETEGEGHCFHLFNHTSEKAIAITDRLVAFLNRMGTLQTRCSPVAFCNEMESIKLLMNTEHEEAISRCPFDFFINMPFAYSSNSRIKLLLSRYDVESCTFAVGEDIDVPFTVSEFCIVNGLQYCGLNVDLHYQQPSSTLAKHFNGEPGLCNKDNIIVKLRELVKSTEKSDVDDFCRMYILFVFCTLLFPVSSMVVPRGLISYVDDLSAIGEFSWGIAVYQFLVVSMRHHLVDETSYVNGFVVGIMAWFYEHFPTCGCPTSLRAFPRLFRWQSKASNLPLSIDRANEVLDAIQRSQFVEIVATQMKELQLFEPPVKRDETYLGTLATLLREIIVNQKRELKLLGQLVSEKNGMAVDESDGDENEDEEQVDESEDEKALGEEDDGMEESDKEATMEEKGEEYVADILTDMQDNIVEEDVVDAMEEAVDNVVVEAVDKAIEKAVVEEDMKKDMEEVVEEEDVKKNMEEAVEEEDVKKAMNDYASGDDSADSGRHEIRMKQVNDTISSIVLSVRERDDRIKKRKAPDFVTPPPSTAPKMKKKVNFGKTPMDQCSAYVGRLDYPGRDELTSEDQEIIDGFIRGQANEASRAIIYSANDVEIFDFDIYRMLWGLEMRQSVFEGYVDILSRLNMTRIWAMSSHVTTCVLDKLPREKFIKGSKKKLKAEDLEGMDKFLADNVMKSVRSLLERLNPDVLGDNRYIIFPLNTKNHWHMVVLDTELKVFKRLNSMISAVATGHAKLWAKFIRMFLFHAYKYEIPSDDVHAQVCPSQGDDSLDCSAFLCLFAECFARDDPIFWKEFHHVRMPSYRAQLVVKILAAGRQL